MKNNYCRIQNIFFALALSMLWSACSQDLTYYEAMHKNQRKIEDPERLDDARFLVEARSFNLLEMKLARLASTNGYAAKIINLAKKDIESHEDLSRELDRLAAKERIILPDQMNDEHQSIFFDVTRADRKQFDKEYLNALERVNSDISRRFTTMATEAKDADVRAFAARKLDLLRGQEKLLSELEDELLDTY